MEERKQLLFNDGTVKEMTFSEWFKENKNLINYLLKNRVNSNTDLDEYDDLFQIASLAAFKAFKSYDISKGSCFATLVSYCVTNELNMRYRKYKRKPDTISYEERVSDTEHIQIKDMLEDISESIDIDYFVISETVLSFIKKKNHLEIFKLALKGYNQHEIANHMRYNQGSISRILNKYKKQLLSCL